MTRIVMVPGAGDSLWGLSPIRARRYPAPADGLAWHEVDSAKSDVAVAVANSGYRFRNDPDFGNGPQFDSSGLLPRATRVAANGNHEVDVDELVKTLSDPHLDQFLA